jgi:hypothetical protein
MMFRQITFFFLSLTLAGIIVGCGSSATPETETVPATEVIEAPTERGETAVVNQAPTCTVTQPLNLFFGPGLSFPAIRQLAPNETLTPLAFSAQGFPDGQWLEVAVVGTGQQGWVAAGSSFITCNVNPASLPPAATIPPTPTVAPTATTQVAATEAVATQVIAQARPPRITNNAPGGTKADYVKDLVIVDDAFLFRIWIADTRFGDFDGAGIAHADFTISTQDQSQVIYENREDQAAYCVFQGGLPDCNVWLEDNGRYFWRNGIEVQPGSYHATILVYPQAPAFDDEVWNWDFDFWIDQ